MEVDLSRQPLKGTTLNETYTLGAVIGRGGQGVVYQAWKRTTGEFVAVKTLRPVSSDSVVTEIELLSKLDHPNIVKYFDVVDEGGRLYVVLEYMENGSLASVRKQFGNFPEAVCAKYVRQVLAGLEYLHGQGVLHRDIKAANILTTKNGGAKLADFGLAARAAAFGDASVQDEVIGSPYWMAPEIIEMAAAPSAACDIWSVGCTIIELTTGRPPHFDLAPMAALFRIVQDDLPPFPEGVSEVLRDFLLQCFNRESVLRADATQLLKHAWVCQNHNKSASFLAANAPPPPPPPPPEIHFRGSPKSYFPSASSSPQQPHHQQQLSFTSTVALPARCDTSSSLGGDEETTDYDGDTSSRALVSLRRLTCNAEFDHSDKIMPLSESDLDAFLDDNNNNKATRLKNKKGTSSKEDHHHHQTPSPEKERDHSFDGVPIVDDDFNDDFVPRSPQQIVEERDLLRRLHDATNLNASQERFERRTAQLFEHFKEEDDNYDDAFALPDTKPPPPPPPPHLKKNEDVLATYREGQEDEDAYDDDFAAPAFPEGLSLKLASAPLARLNRPLPSKTLNDDVDDDDDLDSEDSGSSLSMDTKLERTSSLNDVANLLATEPDPFFTNDFFDDEADFLHDDRREQEAKRLEEIDSLLQRLPLGFISGSDDDDENDDDKDDDKDDDDDDDSFSRRRKRKSDHLASKTEAACAQLQRLVDLGDKSHQEHSFSSFELGDHALASLLEALQRAWVDRRSPEATLAVLRVVLSVVLRSQAALDQLVAFGLSPLLGRVAADLEAKNNNNDDNKEEEDGGLKVASSILATMASLAEVLCSRGSDDALRLFVGGGGLGLLVALLLPRRTEEDELDDSDHSLRIDANRWSAAKLAVDALLCVVRREPRDDASSALSAALSAAAYTQDPSHQQQRRLLFQEEKKKKKVFQPSRNALCSTLARLGAPPRLAAGLAAAMQLEDAARRSAASSGDNAATTRRIAVAQALAEKSAAALSAFCEADALVRQRMAQPATFKIVLAVLLAAPKRIALMAAEARRDPPALLEPMRLEADMHAKLAVVLVKALKALCMASADALDALASAGAIEVVVGVLGAAQRGLPHQQDDDDDASPDDFDLDAIGDSHPQQQQKNGDSPPSSPDDDDTETSGAFQRTTRQRRTAFPRRDELEDQLVPCIYYLCRIDRARLARAAHCGAARRLAACVARRRHLKQFALAILCELCHAASADVHGKQQIAAELWRAGGVRLYTRLLAEAYWGVRALAALAAWLARDKTQRVEAELATAACAERVVDLLRSAQRAEFEHALTPLRDALECSSPFALALLRIDRLATRQNAENLLSPRSLLQGQGTTRAKHHERRRKRPHAFAREIARRLRRHTSAIVRKLLLEILRAALKAAEHPRSLLIEADLVTTLSKLGRDTSQVLVSGLATSILEARYADDLDNLDNTLLVLSSSSS